MTEYGENSKNIESFVSGDRVDGVYALDKFTKATTSTGDTYVKVVASDATGKVSGNLWQFDKENADGHLSDIKEGDLVSMTAVIGEYRDNIQLSDISLLKVEDLGELSQELIFQLAGRPVYDHQEFIDKVLTYITMMSQGPWREIVQRVYNKYEELIWTSPAAASMHHDMNGGLALHTLTMTESAVSLYNVYKHLYPNLNLDLLIAGTLLHDVGKVIELSGPIATHYTGIGVLEGHIVIGASAIQQAAIELGYDPNSEEIQLLVHMVLAHHLKGEWGSPVSPAFIEAQLLHNIDKIDADMQEFKKTEAEIGVGEATSGRWHGIDGRVYRPSIHPDVN